MRLATILDSGRPVPAVVEDDQVLAITAQDPDLAGIRAIAARGQPGLVRLRAWIARRPSNASRPLRDVELGPAVPDPGAIFTITDNYAAPTENPRRGRPERPQVAGKLPISVAAHEATVTWNRTLTQTVEAGVALAIVIGEPAWEVRPADAARHILGYTCLTDLGSRDPELGGEHGLLGRSLPGFCPVGPWIVTADELEPHDLRLACAVNGAAVQDARTSQLRFSVAEIVSYLSYHVPLRPGDLIATGTPPRLVGRPGSERPLEAGDVVTSWIEGLGTLATRIA